MINKMTINNHTIFACYGIINHEGEYFDCSNTERGAKLYATKNHYKKVYIRYGGSYNIALISEKINGKWINKN
jgi:hypothetical protein